MKCPFCGFEAEGNVDKCLKCEEPFEPGDFESDDDEEELEEELDEIDHILTRLDFEDEDNPHMKFKPYGNI